MTQFLSIVILSLSCSLCALATRVVVIRDDDAALYSKATLGVGVELREPFSEYSLMGHASRGAQIVKKAIEEGARVIIAIGPKAAQAAKESAKDISVIYCLTPRIEDYNLSEPHVVGIRLEIPLAKQLSLLKALQPKIRRIAVVADPDSSQKLLERLRSEAKRFEVEIVLAEAKIPSAVSGALRDLQTKVDALLLISDPVALKVGSFEAMVRFAERVQIPFMALDDGFVAQGALLSFAVDYGLTGRQAAALANRILGDGASFKDTTIVEHEALNLAVNVAAAERIFKDGPFFKQLLQIAARDRYGVEAF